jgi:competence protein ComEC
MIKASAAIEPMKKYGLIVFLVLFFSFLISPNHRTLSLRPETPPKVLSMTIFDVGQGDSIFLQSPTGTQVLIDGGPDGTVLNKLAHFMPRGDRSIDMVVLTHPHADHVDGLIDVLINYKINTILVSTVAYDSAVYAEFLGRVEEEGSKIIAPIAGDRFEIGGGAVLTAYWPSFDSTRGSSSSPVLGVQDRENVNNASIVLGLKFGEFDALFTGDAEYPVQEQLQGRVGEIEVLKVSHHGAQDGMNRAWDEELSPELAVISVGENTYGHPHQAVLSFLQSNVPQVLRTDIVGDVTVISDGETWSVLDP